MNKTLKLAAAGLALAAFATASPAHENHVAKPKGAAELAPEQKPWGIVGKPGAVKRTIDIAMADDMTFTPSVIEVRAVTCTNSCSAPRPRSRPTRP